MSKCPSFPQVRVVGMHFRGAEAVEYASALQPGDKLFLEREPENIHDQNAIKVNTEGGMHLGYLERGQAAWISGWMDEGNTFEVTVDHVLTYKNNNYPVVNLEPIP